MPTRRNGWSECTRYVAYEPGRVDRGWLRERQEGRFTFEAKALAAEMARRYPSDFSKGEEEGRDEDLIEFHQWLSRADLLDDRVTLLPERETGFRLMMGEMVMRGNARIHCRLCRRGIDPTTLREEEARRQLPYHSNEIRCPAGHLLLRPFVIHLCLAPPPVIREELRKLREERGASCSG